MSDVLLEKVQHALGQLERVSDFAKARHQAQVIELSGRIMTKPNGVSDLYTLAAQFEAAGLFLGTDWNQPENLLPGLVPVTLEQGDKNTVILDCLSQLRMLAIAEQVYQSHQLSAEQAKMFLAQVLALNLKLLTSDASEVMRSRLGALSAALPQLFRFLLEHLGYDRIFAQLIDEIWRLLSQRPIEVSSIKAMVTQVAIALQQEDAKISEARLGADRLVCALFSPTQHCKDDPGLDAYAIRIGAMDKQALQQEANGFARAMHDVGLVSDYHAVFLRYLLQNGKPELIADAMGLSATGIDILNTYQTLIHTLIEEAIFPETAQTIYGLSQMLESGILHHSPVAPSLWRQIGLHLSPAAEQAMTCAFGSKLAPRVYLLSGVMAILGQPLGVTQGNHPTCQSARALSMWAYNDPDYLLHIIAQVARYDSVIMHFEGRSINSSIVSEGSMANILPLGTDPVSILLVPHLDRIYLEMGRICADRGEDPHRWINPEFHGWWVGRDFFIAVDIKTGKLHDYDHFIRQFFQSYHPLYNGNQPLIHPQPVGIAVTDSNAQVVGWHAVTLLRVTLDQENVTRCYFYNPNHDSGQNWGNGVQVSTHGYGERYGEASLPFEQFLSRLYIFHGDPLEEIKHVDVPKDLLLMTKDMAIASWAKDKLPPTLAAEKG